jgi:hypothetical protein
MVRGDLHSADPRVPGPDGAPSFEQLETSGMPWSEAFLAHTATRAAELRARFQRTVQQ